MISVLTSDADSASIAAAALRHQDLKISQLRTAAIKFLAKTLEATDGGLCLPEGTRGAISLCFKEMMEGEKNTVVKAEVAKTAKMLSGA